MYCYGFGTLIDGLYHFNLDVKFSKSLFHVEYSTGSKSNARNECCAFLWHQSLGHISKERMLRLVKVKFYLNWILMTGCMCGLH